MNPRHVITEQLHTEKMLARFEIDSQHARASDLSVCFPTLVTALGSHAASDPWRLVCVS